MEKKQKFIVNIIFYGLVIVLIWAVCKYVLPVLVPFIIAFVISSLIRMPVKRLYGKSEIRNKFISIITCIVFYVVVFSLVAVIGVELYNTISDFLVSVPGIYQNDIVPALNMIATLIEETIESMDAGIASEIHDIFQDLLNNIGEYIKTFSVNAVKLVSGSLVGIPEFVIKLVVMIISTFFFTIDYDKVLHLLKRLIPGEKEDAVLNLVKYYKNTLFIYLKAYSLLFLLTYVELSIGFSILRIPYPLLIAFLVAFFDILPILGVGGILLPWAVILFVMKEIPMGIGMLILYLVITFIRNTAEPKLVGKQIGLHPLATMIFMYLGLRFMGFWGMFLFPVTLAVFVNMKHDEGIIE